MSHEPTAPKRKISEQLPARGRRSPKYKIFLYHDGHKYVSHVPELPECSAKGKSYAEALQAAQDAIDKWVAEATANGIKSPRLIEAGVLVNALDLCASSFIQSNSGVTKGASVRQKLVNKFGKLSNRELAACLGVFGKDAPGTLACAVAGQGTRLVRCKIAKVLDALPSELWPSLTKRVLKLDDAFFLTLEDADNMSKNE
jgi:predicted RNase H-like HicB family nuclease